MSKKEWNPGIAVFLSLLFPGVGQIYKGQVFGGFGWMLLVGAAYGLSGVMFMGAALLGAGLGSFLVLGSGVILHIVCIIWAAVGDPQKASGALHMLLFLVVGAISLYLYNSFIRSNSSYPPAKSTETYNYSPTHCGKTGFEPSRLLLNGQWTDYRCKAEYLSGGSWTGCLDRIAYTDAVGYGCPGNQKCCPPSR
jgi:hypothetical protein